MMKEGYNESSLNISVNVSEIHYKSNDYSFTQLSDLRKLLDEYHWRGMPITAFFLFDRFLATAFQDPVMHVQYVEDDEMSVCMCRSDQCVSETDHCRWCDQHTTVIAAHQAASKYSG